MHHSTDPHPVHVFTCVLALRLAHLMRYRARQEGLDLSVRERASFGGIEETVLVYPSSGRQPEAAGWWPGDRAPARGYPDLRPGTIGAREFRVIHETSPARR